ncbi:MAG: 6-phosphofructokinase, partial [Clostridiales bacterium]|nr:6-phosphofructokinase [Clostridiales bacterium]
LEGKLLDMTKQDPRVIEGLRYTPGAAIRSCRYQMKQEDQEKLLDVCRKHNIRYFFYNGGNDSMDTAHKTFLTAQAAGYEMQVIGIPKTVDNDLPFTDHCPGYGSAAKYIAATVRETGLDLESVTSSNKVTILEAMGRNAGWLTAAGALAKRSAEEAPHLIYLPETVFREDRFLADVERVYNELGYVYVVVSEGITDEKGEYYSAGTSVDAFGHKQLSGAGESLKSLIEQKLKIKARCNTLGTAQRAAAHFASRRDAEEAYAVGAEAVRYALSGKSGVMVAIKRLRDEPYEAALEPVELSKVANVEHKLPLEWINEAGNFVKDGFIRYARPLIEGEIDIPMKNGLPDYVRLDFSKGRV